MKSVSGTMLATASAKVYRAVGRAVKNIEVGSLVRIARKNWKTKPVIGVVMGRQYLAYESRFCRWRVMVDNEMRIIHESNLFLLKETG